MNNAQLYLAWLRTYSPTVYAQAVRKATKKPRSLGGLADDLLNKALAPDLHHSFLGDDTGLDTITVDSGTPIDFSPSPVIISNPIGPVDVGPIDVSAPTPLQIASGDTTPAPSGTSSTFANILTAVGSIGAGFLTATNQSKLIALNTQRAAQGLPPLNANGQVVSPYSTATTSPTLLAFEKMISGGSGSLLPILAVLGIGAFFLLRKKSA